MKFAAAVLAALLAASPAARAQPSTAQTDGLPDATAITRIPAIQGRGARSPLAGRTVTTEGVVTRVKNNGFFLQDASGDGDAATSDGIFVFTGGAVPAAATPGALLRLRARVVEFNTGAADNAATRDRPLTQLDRATKLQAIGGPIALAALGVSLPQGGGEALERVEGMLVRVAGPLTVSQNFFLGRYGQLTVSAGGRLETPTHRVAPGGAARALAEENARRSLLLDDASSAQNPKPVPYIGAESTVRAGDTLASLTGVIDFGLSTASRTGAASYRLQPTLAPVIVRTNPRTPAPQPVGGNLKVASFNLRNYFTTFTDGRTADGRSGQGCRLGRELSAAHCRGASDAVEFARQRAKIVAALAALDADLIGLIEIQNNGAVGVGDLVAGLNAAVGRGTYAALLHAEGAGGSDAIQLAMIYKPAVVQPHGLAQADPDRVHHRPPLAQTFVARASGERFTLVVAHFKSKGCDGASGADLDQGDGQGCFNATRLAQAQALAAFVERLRRRGGPAEALILGDLNAYAREDPIARLAEAGLADQIARFTDSGHSFVFEGAAGRLDHALASIALAAKLVRATVWHINADEPSVIDYNTEFKPQDLYAPTAYRSSDHDPVLVGLDLRSPPAAVSAPPARAASAAAVAQAAPGPLACTAALRRSGACVRAADSWRSSAAAR